MRKLHPVIYWGIFISLFMVQSLVSAQTTTLTLADYDSVMSYWKNRETQNQEEIILTQNQIQQIQTEITAVEKANKDVWQEIYDLIESDEAGVRKFMQQLDAIEKKIDGYDGIPKDEQQTLRQELNHKVAASHKNTIGAMSEVHEKLGKLEKRMILINLKSK